MKTSLIETYKNHQRQSFLSSQVRQLATADRIWKQQLSFYQTNLMVISQKFSFVAGTAMLLLCEIWELPISKINTNFDGKSTTVICVLHVVQFLCPISIFQSSSLRIPVVMTSVLSVISLVKMSMWAAAMLSETANSLSHMSPLPSTSSVLSVSHHPHKTFCLMRVMTKSDDKKTKSKRQ